MTLIRSLAGAAPVRACDFHGTDASHGLVCTIYINQSLKREQWSPHDRPRLCKDAKIGHMGL